MALGQFPGPGTATVVLRTPLGVWIVDPFAPPDPTIDKIIKWLGIEVEMRLGPPTPEDLAAPQLSTGLVMVAGAMGLVAWNLWTARRGPPRARNPLALSPRPRRARARRRRRP